MTKALDAKTKYIIGVMSNYPNGLSVVAGNTLMDKAGIGNRGHASVVFGTLCCRSASGADNKSGYYESGYAFLDGKLFRREDAVAYLMSQEEEEDVLS